MSPQTASSDYHLRQPASDCRLRLPPQTSPSDCLLRLPPQTVSSDFLLRLPPQTALSDATSDCLFRLPPSDCLLRLPPQTAPSDFLLRLPPQTAPSHFFLRLTAQTAMRYCDLLPCHITSVLELMLSRGLYSFFYVWMSSSRQLC